MTDNRPGGSTTPTSCSSACRAPRRRRPASISPIAASRRPTCRSCRACRCRPSSSRRRDRWSSASPTIPERLIQVRRNRLSMLHQGRSRRLYRSRGGARRSGDGAPPLRREALAGDRRDTALDRGDGGGDPEAAGEAPRPGCLGSRRSRWYSPRPARRALRSCAEAGLDLRATPLGSTSTR